jgi:hypothetical protein
MRSGSQTLHQIDSAIGRARETLDNTARLAEDLAARRAGLERERLDAVHVIASERLNILGAGEAREARDRDIRRADRQAEELLENHAREIAGLRAEAEKANSELERLEAERKAQEDKVWAAVEAFDEAAAATQSRLAEDEAYKTQLAAVEEAEAFVDRAEQKRALAEGDEAEKGRPYRDDPLFSYLWDRHYSTKDYRGGLIAKLLDDWVAGLVGYRDAALNYKRLTEIPKRLAAHVDRVEEKAEAERTALKALEDEALERDGAAKLRDRSLAEQAELDAIDEKIAAAEADFRRHIDAETAATGRNNDAFNQALAILTDTLKYEDIPDLRVLAAQTTSLDDDEAVARLIRIEDEREDLDRDEDDAKALIEKYRRSLEELEQVRRRFKQARYDAPDSRFPPGTGDLIGTMIGEILAGVLTSGDVWDHLRRGHRRAPRRTDYDFGGDDWAGGFRFPMPGRPGRSGGGVPTRPSRMPRQRSGRGGGRGGGFRTGGGF